MLTPSRPSEQTPCETVKKSRGRPPKEQKDKENKVEISEFTPSPAAAEQNMRGSTGLTLKDQSQFEQTTTRQQSGLIKRERRANRGVNNRFDSDYVVPTAAIIESAEPTAPKPFSLQNKTQQAPARALRSCTQPRRHVDVEDVDESEEERQLARTLQVRNHFSYLDYSDQQAATKCSLSRVPGLRKKTRKSSRWCSSMEPSAGRRLQRSCRVVRASNAGKGGITI